MAPFVASIPDEVAILIALPILGSFIVAMTAIIADHRRKMQRDDMEATLKMDMLNRGMSAEEIERVLAARLGGRGSHRGRRHCASDSPAGQSLRT